MITRQGASAPIGRHKWLSVAVDAPALVLMTLHPDLPEHHGIDHPAFGLHSCYGPPILFWRNGEVVVKKVGDQFLFDLRAVARMLDAQLVHPDGREAESGD